MTNINRRYAKTRVSSKPWHWYFDRLPGWARKALSEADHNWSDEQVYNLWKGTRGHPKLPKGEILAILQREDARIAYNWMEEA